MHYYQHNIADYRKDTSHLSLLEHGVYHQLINQYYLTEQPIPLEETKLYRLMGARSEDEKIAIQNVLEDFFVKTEIGFIHKRCDIEIEAYQAKSQTASQSAKKMVERKKPQRNSHRSEARYGKCYANAYRTQSDRYANHKP